MSVYIKGMKMPTGCDNCYFLGEMGICSALLATHRESGLVGDWRWNEFERPPHCPLVSVQDHGRLIDADALFKKIGMDGNFGVLEAMYIQSIIHDAPTIIPADA